MTVSYVYPSIDSVLADYAAFVEVAAREMARAEQQRLLGLHTCPSSGNRGWECSVLDDRTECEHCSLYRWHAVQYPMLSSVLEIPTEEGEENTPLEAVAGRDLPLKQLSLPRVKGARDFRAQKQQARDDAATEEVAAPAAPRPYALSCPAAAVSWADLADSSVAEDEEAMERLLQEMVSKPSPSSTPSIGGQEARGPGEADVVAVSPSSTTGRSWADMLDDDEEEEAEALEAIRRELTTGRVSVDVEEAPEPVRTELAGVAPSQSWADMVEETEDEASGAMDALLSEMRAKLDRPATSSTEEVGEESAEEPAPVGFRSPSPRPSGDIGLLSAGIGMAVVGRPLLPSAARACLSPAAMASAVAEWAR